jgi:hypothetical protein
MVGKRRKAGKQDTPKLVRVWVGPADAPKPTKSSFSYRLPDGGVSFRPPAPPEPQAKKVRRKPAQERVHVALRKHFPPDGKVPDKMSTETVRQRIGWQYSWDTVNRALGRA